MSMSSFFASSFLILLGRKIRVVVFFFFSFRRMGICDEDENVCLTGCGEDTQSNLSMYYTVVKPIRNSRSKRKDLCGHIFQLSSGLFFHVGEHFTLSVKRKDASIEERGHLGVSEV